MTLNIILFSLEEHLYSVKNGFSTQKRKPNELLGYLPDDVSLSECANTLFIKY